MACGTSFREAAHERSTPDPPPQRRGLLRLPLAVRCDIADDSCCGGVAVSAGVLAVMDDLVRHAGCPVAGDPGTGLTAARLRLVRAAEARATVAELIATLERDREVMVLASSRLEVFGNRAGAKWPKLHARNAQQACDEQIAKLDAALARAAGGRQS